jgi:hypothetical protein
MENQLAGKDTANMLLAHQSEPGAKKNPAAGRQDLS